MADQIHLWNGVVFIVLMTWGSFVSGVVFLPVPVLLMLIPSKMTLKWSRYLVNAIEHIFIIFACIVVEKWAGTKIVFTGELPSNQDICILACNHRTRVDWVYIWSLVLRSDSMRELRVILKESLKSVPFFGWVMQALLFIFLSRDRTQDVPHISKMTAHHVNTSAFPPTFLIFPEGTDLSDSNLAKANKWGAENGLVPREQVLHPRITGLLSMLNAIPKDAAKLYDVTMAYKDFDTQQRTSEVSLLRGKFPREVHIDVRRVPNHQVPRSRPEVDAWLKESFNNKEVVLREFYDGKRQSLAEMVPNVNVERRVSQMFHKGMVMWTALTAVVLYSLYTFPLFRWYCALAIVGFTLTTTVTNGIDSIDLRLHGSRKAESKLHRD